MVKMAMADHRQATTFHIDETKDNEKKNLIN